MVHHSSGSRISVAEGWTDQIVVSVEQHVVDAPGIDTEANDSIAVFVDRFADSDFDFFPEREQIPKPLYWVGQRSYGLFFSHLMKTQSMIHIYKLSRVEICVVNL